MKFVVFGAAGVLGRSVCAQLRSRGHEVLGVARGGADLRLAFEAATGLDAVRSVVRGADIVVNTVGILMERGANRFEVAHVQAPGLIAAACEAERVARIVHVSALGVDQGIGGGYLDSKARGEAAIAGGAVDYAILRPSLLFDDASASTRLFQWLARLPMIGLPGLLHPGASVVEPLASDDLATCIVHIAEHPKALRCVIELAGPQAMRYRDMLARLRAAQGISAPALWMPVPWPLMRLGAWLAQQTPQKVVALDAMRLLQAGRPAAHNETARWLGRPARRLGEPDPAPAAPAAAAQATGAAADRA